MTREDTTPPAGAARRAGPRRRGRGRGARRSASRMSARLVVTALLLAGALVTLWPIGRSATAALEVARTVRAYESSIDAAQSSALVPEIDAAQAYNDALPAGALEDPWGTADASDGADHARYLSLLDPDSDGVIGEVRIPKIDVDLPIRHDADWTSMAHGAGHMYGTSLPVGGEGSHAVIAAHTGATTGTFFDRLPELGVGDVFEIDVAGRTLYYEVDRTLVVLPDAIDEVRREEGKDLVTLVTCVDLLPNGTHAKRLLVRGHRIDGPGDAASEAAGLTTVIARVIPGYDPRMNLRLGFGSAALLLLALAAIGWIREDRSGRAGRADRAATRPEPARAPGRDAPEQDSPGRDAR